MVVICLVSCRYFLRALDTPGRRAAPIGGGQGPSSGGGHLGLHPAGRGQALLSCLVGYVTGGRSPQGLGPSIRGYWDGTAGCWAQGRTRSWLAFQAPRVLGRSPGW